MPSKVPTRPSRESLIHARDWLLDQEALRRIREGGADLKTGQWVPGPLYWLWNHTKTFDHHWQANNAEPYRRMARLPYLPWLFNLFMTEPILFVPKSREMRVSWSLMAYAVWSCQVFPQVLVIIQSQKLDKANDLVKGKEAAGYARTLWEQQDDWLKREFQLACRIEDMPANRMTWANGSVLMGVPGGADQVRQYHPTVYISDEAAHQEDFQACFDSALPVAKQMIAVSSAAPSWFGDVCQEGR